MKKFKILTVLFLSLILLTSCTLPGLGGNTDTEVIIASGNTTERQIVTEIVSQMIEHYTDLNVSIISNLGSSIMIHIAMENNDINMSGGMYTGTSITGELGMEPITDPEKAMEVVREEYFNEFRRIWFPSYGFENTYAFMVTEEFAKEHNLSKVSDLEKLKDDVTVGVDTSWINRQGDGYTAFQEIYGFSFDEIYPMEIGLVYSALRTGDMDVVLGYSTDGRINSYDLMILEDDLNLFPAYDCSPVSTEKILQKHPELIEVLLKLEGVIDSSLMQEMNRKGAEDLIEPRYVAKEFLEENNYFEDKKPDPKEVERIRGDIDVD